jgi:hypothetical protein
MTVIAEPGTAPDGRDSLLSLHYNDATGKIFGLWVGGTALTLHSLLPTGSGTWDPPTPLTGVPSTWNTVGGNSAVCVPFPFARVIVMDVV